MNRIEKAKNQKDLMTFEEACQFFRVSKPTLLNALKSGEISGFKLGGQWRVWRYREDYLEKIIITFYKNHGVFMATDGEIRPSFF